MREKRSGLALWFDVEIGYYTTDKFDGLEVGQLWFDVEIGYYTTFTLNIWYNKRLWFDVEIGYYTTIDHEPRSKTRCDLM